ncbi:MAG: ABC transporter substrate-binding protein [Firmicutes bacterium]|nr:ABC transporter substrate-binding protein [Bacillota bacterium]
MKKTLAIILLLVLCCAVGVACCACDLDDDVITVTIYSTMGKTLKETFDSYLKQFEAMYPGIKVDHQVPLNDYTELRGRVLTELETNDGPAITYCYPDHVAMYMEIGASKRNCVVPLDQYVDSTAKVAVGEFGNTEEHLIGFTAEEKADFIEAYYNEGKESYGDGSVMYSLPYAKSTEVLFYNKDFFTANNIELPTHWFATTPNVDDDKTSMEYVCKRIKGIDKNCIPLGYDADDNFFITMCEQYMTLEENSGTNLYTSSVGDKYLFNNAVNKGWMEKFNKMYRDGYLITRQTNSTVYTSKMFVARDSDKDPSDPNYVQSKCTYMCIGSTGGATNQVSKKFETGVTTIPQMNPEDPKVISQGPSICILKNKNNKSEKQQLAAWLVAKYMTSNTTLQAAFSMDSGYAPSRHSVYTDPVYKEEFLDLADGKEYIAATAALQCYQQISYSFTSPSFVGSATARDEVKTLFGKCLRFTAGTQTIADQITEAFNTALATCQFKNP